MAVAVAHGRAIGFGFTSLDDLTLLVDDQPFLTSAGAPWRAFGRTYFQVVDATHAYYRPVITASYALDVRIFGTAHLASGSHLTNVLLHLIASWMVLALLEHAKVKREVVLGVAVVFAVHPAVVQTVAWLPGRNDSLLAIFALSALLTDVRARASTTWRASAAWRLAHVGSFALAMFSKETAIVIPLVCLAWARVGAAPRDSLRQPRRGDVVATFVGWGLVLIAFAMARDVALSEGGASTSMAAIDWYAAARHLSVLLSSAGKISCPIHMAPIATIEDTPVWPGVAALLVLGVLSARVRRSGALRLDVVAFGVGLYILALLPTLFTPGSLALENRLYLPTIGIVVVVAELADKARIERSMGTALASVTVGAFIALSWGHSSAYRDPLAFGRAAVVGAPHASLAHFTLGQARQLGGDLDGAMREYQTALALDPSEPIVHNNMAVIHMRHADWPRAQAALEAELRVNPGYARALENLALVKRRLVEE